VADILKTRATAHQNVTASLLLATSS